MRTEGSAGVVRRLSLVLLAAALLLAPACGRGVRIGDGTNIVLIVIDTLRADALPFYGAPRDTAPFLDGLAARSAVFDRAYAASSWTAPSTASLLTGLYPFQHGVVSGIAATRDAQPGRDVLEINRIPAAAETLAETLKGAGYRTFAVTDNHNVCETLGFDDGFDVFINHSYAGAEAVNADLAALEGEIRSGGPYFLYMHYMDPHKPYHEREPWFAPRGEKRRKNSRAAYESEIGYVDARIREAFERFGWEERTLVVVTADHGEEFNDHGSSGHGRKLFEESVRVPLLFFNPGGGIEPARIAPPVSLVDVVPTLRTLAGLPAGEGLAGLSLAPLLAGAARAWPERDLYGHLVRTRAEFRKTIRLQSVVRGKWKFITRKSGLQMLFDLERDPRERRNLFGEARATAGELRASYDRFVSRAPRLEAESVRVTLDGKVLEQLKSLGYMQ